MSKRGKLSVAELEYIANHREEGSEAIGKVLDRTKDSVQKVIDSLPAVVAQAPPPTQTSETPPQQVLTVNPETTQIRQDDGHIAPIYTAGGLMGRKMQRNNKNKPIATVMTPAAAERADDFKQVRKAKRLGDDAVHKPLGENPQYR